MQKNYEIKITSEDHVKARNEEIRSKQLRNQKQGRDKISDLMEAKDLGFDSLDDYYEAIK